MNVINAFMIDPKGADHYYYFCEIRSYSQCNKCRVFKDNLLRRNGKQ